MTPGSLQSPRISERRPDRQMDFLSQMKRDFAGILKMTLDTLTGQPRQKSLAEQYHPKLASRLQKFVVFCDICSFSPTWVIWHDFYKDNKALAIYFQVMMCSAYFFLLLPGTLGLVDKVIEERIRQTGTPEQKQALEMKEELSNIQQTIEECSIAQFDRLMSKQGRWTPEPSPEGDTHGTSSSHFETIA